MLFNSMDHIQATYRETWCTLRDMPVVDGQIERTSLWRVAAYGDEVHTPAEQWHYDNAGREPAGMIVFQYVLSGRMRYADAAGESIAADDCAAIFVHGEQSRYGMADDVPQRLRTQWLGLLGAGLAEHVAELRREHGSIFRFGRDHGVRDAMRALMRIAEPRRASDPLVVADEVHQFIGRLFRHARQSRESALTPVERAIDDLLRYPVATRSLKELAQRHGVSREHVTRVFVERTGRSPASYLADKRLERAMELLEQTSLPLASVARQAGYGTPHALARHVRRATDRSPGRLRHTLQKKATIRP